jgi:hypothetical protein
MPERTISPSQGLRIWSQEKHQIRIRNISNITNANAICSSSVADPGCLSRILIFTHPGSRISDPKTAMKDRGEKVFVVIPFFGAIKFTKLN